jgi:proteasome lid subunit RPN8/RPN11
MIVWREQQPDFFRRPLDDLLRRIPFTIACAIVFGPVKIVVPRKVLQGIFEHLREQLVEMGGLLIGSVHEDVGVADRFVVSVADYVRSVNYDGTSVSLRMGTDVWERARSKATDGQVVIGWYHSHPNLGVFFSGTDRRTQRAFFNNSHSLGLVVDPVRDQEMWFIGGDSAELEPGQILSHS